MLELKTRHGCGIHHCCGSLASDPWVAKSKLAVDFGCGLITNMKCAQMFCDALHRNKALPVKSAEEYVDKAQVGYVSQSALVG